MSAEVTITETPQGWKVVANDTSRIRVETEDGDLHIRIKRSDTPSQPLDVKLAE